MGKTGYQRELVPNPRPAAHGCNVCRLADGRLWLIWFAGTREGVEDQRILMSLCENGSWTEPRILVGHPELHNERWIPEIGAPVVDEDPWVAYSASPLSSFSYRENRDVYLPNLKQARLFLARVDPGTWRAEPGKGIIDREGLILQGRSIRWDDRWLLQCNSYDGQDRHSATLVFGHPFGEWEQVRELTCSPGCLEPSMVRFSDGSLLCYSRYWGYDGCIWRSESAGELSDLTDPAQTTLRNPNSGIDIAVDNDDRMVIAYNDSHRLRTPLTLGVSSDRGATWRCRDIEIEQGEYSYPKLIETDDGQWHVFYTWRRECIAHVQFGLDWLDGGRPVYGLDPER